MANPATREERTPTRDESSFDETPRSISSVTWIALVFTVLLIIFGALALSGFFTTGEDSARPGSSGPGAAANP